MAIPGTTTNNVTTGHNQNHNHAESYNGGDCAICMSSLTGPDDNGNHIGRAVTLDCGHAFHRDCTNQMLNYSSRCPTCRADINIEKLNDELGSRHTARTADALRPTPSDGDHFNSRDDNVLWNCDIAHTRGQSMDQTPNYAVGYNDVYNRSPGINDFISLLAAVLNQHTQPTPVYRNPEPQPSSVYLSPEPQPASVYRSTLSQPAPFRDDSDLLLRYFLLEQQLLCQGYGLGWEDESYEDDLFASCVDDATHETDFYGSGYDDAGYGIDYGIDYDTAYGHDYVFDLCGFQQPAQGSIYNYGPAGLQWWVF